MLCFGHNPPTKNDNEFFIDAADAIDKLSGNILELEKAAQKKEINILDNDYAERILVALLSKNGIERDFFSDLEKAHTHDVEAYIRFYNQDRLHTANDDLSPIEYEPS